MATELVQNWGCISPYGVTARRIKMSKMTEKDDGIPFDHMGDGLAQ